MKDDYTKVTAVTKGLLIPIERAIRAFLDDEYLFLKEKRFSSSAYAMDEIDTLHGRRKENGTMHSRSTFIVMRGYPGTGKSTIARLLATSLHAPLIDRDIIRRVAVDIFGNASPVGQFSYELLFALTREQLSLGLSVVVDTPLTYRRTYEGCLELARAYDTKMLVVHCQCPPDVQKRRLEGRKGQVSNFQITSWEEWERWKERYEDFEDHGCIIDTSHPMDESLAKVMRRIHELHGQQTYHEELSDNPRL